MEAIVYTIVQESLGIQKTGIFRHWKKNVSIYKSANCAKLQPTLAGFLDEKAKGILFALLEDRQVDLFDRVLCSMILSTPWTLDMDIMTEPSMKRHEIPVLPFDSNGMIILFYNLIGFVKGPYYITTPGQLFF